jgi:AhpD family alkylhydroperoxidase
MARIPPIKENEHPELAALVQKLRTGRRGRLLNIYRALLNSPALAESWFHHSNAVRWKTTLDGRLREIVIIRIGHLTQCEYVLRQHVPALALAEGLTPEESDAVADWQGSTLFTPR